MSNADSPSKESIGRIDELVHKVESLQDPAARASAVELVTAVMSFHAAALDRLMEIVTESASPNTIHLLTADETVASMLVLHGLHPDDLEARVRHALDKLTTFFDSRGAGITLLELSAQLVRVRFKGNRPGSGVAAKGIIEDVIYEAAPELEKLVIEGIEDRRDPSFVPLADLAAQQV
jgi:hypothetical protein